METRKVLVGDMVAVHSHEGRVAKVINVYSKNEEHRRDIRVQFDDETTEDLSFGEFKLMNQ